MSEYSKLVSLFRECEEILSSEQQGEYVDWIGGIADTLSLGDSGAIETYKKNVSGMGGFWEASDNRRFQNLIAQIAQEIEENAH